MDTGSAHPAPDRCDPVVGDIINRLRAPFAGVKDLIVPQDNQIVPVQPGNASAMGMCMSEFRQDFSSGYGSTAAEADLKDLNSKFAALSETAMKSLLSQGISEDKISLEYKADFHYVGQVYENRSVVYRAKS